VAEPLTLGSDGSQALLDDVRRERLASVASRARGGRERRWRRSRREGVERARVAGRRRRGSIGRARSGGELLAEVERGRLEELEISEQTLDERALLAGFEADERAPQLLAERADDGSRLASTVAPGALIKEELEKLDELEPLSLPEKDSRLTRRPRELCRRGER
jgi:hypothetical protein